MSVCRFQNEMKLFESKYELVALSKHMFALFAEFTIMRKKWFSFDDFQDCFVDSDPLSDFLANNNIGRFFKVWQHNG